MLKMISLRTALLLIGVSGAAVTTAVAPSFADDPKTAVEPVKYRRYADPAGDSDVYKILDVVLASASDEVKAEGCKTGPNQVLLKAKLIDAGDRGCPNGVIPDHFAIVIPGIVESITVDKIIVSYRIAGKPGEKREIALPWDLISKGKNVAQGAELFIYPDVSGTKTSTDIVKDFNAFAKKMNSGSGNAGSFTNFSVQLK